MKLQKIFASNLLVPKQDSCLKTRQKQYNYQRNTLATDTVSFSGKEKAKVVLEKGLARIDELGRKVVPYINPEKGVVKEVALKAGSESIPAETTLFKEGVPTEKLVHFDDGQVGVGIKYKNGEISQATKFREDGSIEVRVKNKDGVSTQTQHGLNNKANYAIKDYGNGIIEEVTYQNGLPKKIVKSKIITIVQEPDIVLESETASKTTSLAVRNEENIFKTYTQKQKIEETEFSDDGNIQFKKKFNDEEKVIELIDYEKNVLTKYGADGKKLEENDFVRDGWFHQEQNNENFSITNIKTYDENEKLSENLSVDSNEALWIRTKFDDQGKELFSIRIDKDAQFKLNEADFPDRNIGYTSPTYGDNFAPYWHKWDKTNGETKNIEIDDEIKQIIEETKEKFIKIQEKKEKKTIEFFNSEIANKVFDNLKNAAEKRNARKSKN